MTVALGFTNASLRSFVNEAGRGFPCHFCNWGFGSNRSRWLGPPDMNRKITFLAVGGNCGAFGARGVTEGASAWADRASFEIRLDKAIAPRLHEPCCRKRRLVWLSKLMSFSRDKLVEVQQDTTKAHPSGGLDPIYANIGGEDRRRGGG